MIRELINSFNSLLSQYMEFKTIALWMNDWTKKNPQYSVLFDKGEIWIRIPQNVFIKYTDKMNSVGSVIMTCGKYENVELDIFLKNCNNDSVVFDIGANIGLYSLIIAKKFPNAHIHVFEPVPDVIEELKENFQKNSININNIFLNEIALLDFDGYCYITTDFHSSNYITNSKSSIKKIKIPCMTLDNYIQRQKITKIDIIKIDVEGREMDVLCGGFETLKQFKPLIFIEITEKNPKFFDKKITNYNNIINFLKKIGYNYYVIDDNSKIISSDNIENALLKRSYHNYIFFHESNKREVCI